MTDESLNLLPCPWCNGEARIVESVDTGEKYGGPHFIVRCPSIVGDFVTGCLGNHTNLWDMTPEDAANRWNRRTPQPDKAGVGGWTDAQCWAFASVAFRHAPKNLPKGVELNDIRLAAARVLATPPPPGAGEDRRDGIEYRMFDSQWVNVVNHDRCYESMDKEDAINLAVKMTEQVMAKNIADNRWPKPRATAAMRGEGNG